MIGYCAIASNGIEIRPTRQMNKATTQAKIGRSMKKLAMRGRSARADDLVFGLGLRSLRRLGRRPRLDAVAGGELLEAVDHHAVAGLQAFDHQPAAVLRCAQPHRLQGGAVVVLDDEDLAAATAIALDGLLGNGD